MDIYPGVDGLVSRNAESSWANARDVSTGDIATSTTTSSIIALRTSLTGPGRGSGYYISRCFFSFPTITITHVPKSGTFKVYGATNNNITYIYCVKGKPSIEDGITTGDYNAIDGWDTGRDNTSNVTHYAPNTTSWTTSGYNTFTLNQQALVDIAGQGKFNICLLVPRDLDNTGGGFPPISSTEYSGLNFSNNATVGLRPYISLVEQDDAVFFGANF